jgi:hypothetical protein
MCIGLFENVFSSENSRWVRILAGMAEMRKMYPQYLSKSERRIRWGIHRVDGRIILSCIFKV